MDAPVPLIAVALLTAAALVAPRERLRAAAMLGALALATALLVDHIRSSDQIQALFDRAAVAAAAAAAGVILVAGLAWLIRRRPAALPVLALAALPFRVPIALGYAVVSLLVPLYLVVAAGVLAHAPPRLRAAADDEAGAREVPARRVGALEWALAVAVVLYAAQASYSADVARAVEDVVGAYVPFAVLFALVAGVPWTPRLTKACAGVVVGLALVFAAVGFVEYATRHVFVNPDVVAARQVEDAFRVSSAFFDPNLYGRFLAVAMVLVAAWLLWARRDRDVAAAAVVLAVLGGGLVLTLSRSSLAALLVGLAVLAALRWGVRRAVAPAVGVLAVGAAVVLLAPAGVRADLTGARSADGATGGRSALVSGGVRLFAERRVRGWGAGSFERRYRRAERTSAARAAAASRTTPVTVGAEQGALGLAAYLALVAIALWRLFRGARSSPARAAVAAAFAALLVHTLLYATFLEDPLTWTLLAVGTALAVRPRRAARAPAPTPVAERAGRAPEPAAV